MSGIVIIGTGQAGCQVAASLRERKFGGEITILGTEEGAPYQKPLLSKAFLHGEMGEADLALKPLAFFAQKAIGFHPETTVTGIDRTGRRVGLQDGRGLTYDHLVMATGAENRTLLVAGAGLDGVVTLRSRRDAAEFKQRLAGAARLVIIGAGFIGLEVATAARLRGVPVTVLERGDRMLARAVSQPVSDHLLERHRADGVDVSFGVDVQAFLGEGGRLAGVRLGSGEVLPTTLALVAVGVTPTTGLAETAGLPVENGIIVDEMLTTADCAVHAIGDRANYPHPLLDGRRVRIESIQNAVDQARCLAATLTGTPTAFAKLPWFWSDQCDVRLQIAGICCGGDESVIRGQPGSNSFSVFRLANGRLTAVESVNQAAEHMAARRLVEQRPRLDPIELADTAVPLKQLTAH